MSADLELLQRAETLMRERAAAAIHDSVGVGSWHLANRCEVFAGDWTISDRLSIADAEHIASWDPDVALAVADWLHDEAELLPDTIADQIDLGMTPEDAAAMANILHQPALAVARAYLGESA